MADSRPARCAIGDTCRITGDVQWAGMQAQPLEPANSRLKALIDIGLELASVRDGEMLLKTVCMVARELFGATYVTLGILDWNDRTLYRFLSCGPDTSCDTGTADWIKAGDAVPGFLETVVLDRQTIRGENPGGEPARLRLPVGHPEIRAFVAAPIVSPSRVYGWICVVVNEGRTFTDEDEHLVVALAGQVGRIYELDHEMVERKHAESALREERDRAQGYLDTAAIILLALDVDGRITLINRYACSVLGWAADELLGCDWIETCLPAGVRDAARRNFLEALGGDLSTFENVVLTKSGEERLVDWRNTVLRDAAGRITGTLSSGADVTERRALEAQYQQAQKMEAIGQLAGGVAHDFNNLLTVILGYCELLLADLDPDDPRQNDIAEIQIAGSRASGLTRQLLAFSRKQIIEPTLLDLSVVVTDMRVMLGRLIREDVRMVLRHTRELACVQADRGQVEQIVMNFAVNAQDAMPKGGTLTIETANVHLDEKYAKSHLGVTPGPYVVLSATDTGTGITPEVQARLFEPFFTTKEPGKGTGLGLATVHGIVTRAGGSITVDSQVGRGTTFRAYFPRADGTKPVIEAPSPVTTHAGTETVLVVEDAEGLRELIRRLLRRQGYTVLVAAEAQEALVVFEANPSISVVLTDVVMPGTSGPELTRELVERNPALKVVYMSGYTKESIVQHGVLNPGIAFLHKPFTSEALGRKIREALDREVSLLT
jgi:two-component system cell cycle sensor histidine kinase/response regulator CckA